LTVIGISGSYGGLNLGDEAILTSAIEQLRATVPGVEIVVFARNAEHTRQHHAVDRVVSPREAMRDEITPEVRRLDLLLLGGGGILYDSEAQTYLREVMIAQQFGVPTHAFAIGVGPLRDQLERRAVRDGLNRMAGITVREQSAKRLIEDIGVAVPVTVTADPALLLTPEPFTEAMLADAGIPRDRPLIGMSVREHGAAAPELSEAAYHQLLAEAADFIVERYGADVVFVPMERADAREAHRVMGHMTLPERAHLLRFKYTPRQILGLMEHFEMAVGMRLHFLIFAAITGTPLMALPYASKVYDFLASLGLSPRAMVAHTTAGTFLADLDRLWDHRVVQKALLRERIPELQERARRTVPLTTRGVGSYGAVEV
jgi:polysaccharide pyruvyl transferase CsaB